MKKVAIIGRGLFGRETYGIHRNTKELLINLDKIVPDGALELIVPRREAGGCNFSHIKVVGLGLRNTPGSKLLDRADAFLFKNVFTRLHAMKSSAITVDMLLQFPRYGCDVITIYDCIPEIFPEHYEIRGNVAWKDKLLRRQKRAIQKSRLILTDSNNAKSDIQRFYNVSDDRIEVIPCGWQHFIRVKADPSILDKLGLDGKPFFFSLGSRLPHKNIKWISCAAQKNPNYTFVISGSARSNKDFRFEGEKLPNMIFAGYLSDGEVKALMQHCKAFIQPSMYEGFGIPPMEAMSVGANCIVSDKASLPEVYKKSVWYINPYDYDHIDLDEIMSRPKESNDLILSEYSWEKSARKLWVILQKLAVG